MTVKYRQYIERAIAKAFIRAAIRAGYEFQVFNGEDGVTTKGEKDTLAAMFLTDEDRVYVRKAGSTQCVGWALFVYGNSGWDVLSDYTINLDNVIKDGVQQLIDKWAE